MRGLSAFKVPEYRYSSYRFFERGEKHINRICKDDVLLLVFEGVLRFSENGQIREIKGGEYYIQEKGIYQSGDVTSDSPSYYYVHFLADFEDESPYLLNYGEFDRISLQKYIDSLEESKISKSALIDSASAFLSILAILSGRKRKTENSIASMLSDYVSKNVKENLSLEKMSFDLGYCKNHIIKLFKSSFGVTPHEYLILRRINIAKNLLLSSAISIDEIAIESGFESYVNFYKTFVKHQNCSPGEFRNKYGIK